jgi:hypothetical protein
MHWGIPIALPDSYPAPPIFTASDPTAEPICVAPRSCGKKRPNVFYNDRGFPDQSHDFDVVLHNIDGGCILCKRKHPTPPLNKIDPSFFAWYDETTHGAKLRKELDLSHLDASVRNMVYRLIQKYWSIFDDKGQFIPVKDYSCVIDTGSAKPISVKKYTTVPGKSPSCIIASPPLPSLGTSAM